MANEKTPVVWDDTAKKHRPLGSGEKMGGLSASSMISSDSGNLLQQGSDGLMLVTGGSLADPRADNLLEESDSGKLQVTSDRVVEWLEGHPQAAAAIAEAVKVVSGDDGNVITAGTDKGAFLSKGAISGAVSTMSAAQLSTLASALRKAGGGLSVGSDGKLSVDFGSMDPAIMRNVVLSMVQQGGGIAVDSSGKLYVDFDSMPEDKFNDMLKSLKMQIPLDANMTLVVDGANGMDVVAEGVDRRSVPFKTINACINWFTQTYSIGSHVVTVRVKSGIYTESVNLPAFDRTSGSAVLAAYDSDNPPILTNTGPSARLILCTGPGWTLRRFKFSSTRQAINNGVNNYIDDLALMGNANLTIIGCEFLTSFVGSAPSSGTTRLRVVNMLDGTMLQFTLMENYVNSFEVHKGNATALNVFSVSGGTVVGYGSDSSAHVVAMPAFGEFDVFASVGGRGSFSLVADRAYTQHFVVPSGASATGKRFVVATFGIIQLGASGTFPGDVEGTVDTASYGYYAGGHLQ